MFKRELGGSAASRERANHNKIGAKKTRVLGILLIFFAFFFFFFYRAERKIETGLSQL